MIGNLVQVEVDPRLAGRDFWERFHAYRRARHAESHPDDPVKPDHLIERGMTHDDPFEIKYGYEITVEGEMLSWFRAGTIKPGSPGYDTNRHILWADASVRNDHRRSGIGRTWLPLALELMARHGCTMLSAGTEEASGHAFLRWLGAEAKLTDTENRLQMSEVDWAMLKRWVAEGPKRSPLSMLEVYDDHLPKVMWEDYCPQYASMLNTMPFDDLDHGEIVVTPAQLADWHLQMDLAEIMEHTMLIREPSAVISGITRVLFAPYKATMLEQSFTGVRADSQGRGLGKWLKAAMLLHARELYPSVEWVITGNASSNAPMLAINKKLGFRHYRTSTEYQISGDRLTARMRELIRA